MSFNPTNGGLLVVEDNLELWLLLKDALSLALPEIEVVHASTAQVTLRYLYCIGDEEYLPQLILQDLYLPQRSDGINLLDQLKQIDSPYWQIPVAIMSKFSDPDDIVDVYHLGADTYLVKPTSMDDWIACLRGLRSYWNV
ncbi:response regulator [Spirosoma endbachense]|uniref:Response regulator n=1 Tax=Spirosoma endbachense TaxID=2666025 RepID=A0A6P1VTM4_9BACT|nr:response regulator [Spirosoma endbachense]QHV95077.1 response regulator [Spirosoma endbachense]